jgi:imidazolonepropionase-like amidohydrolase
VILAGDKIVAVAPQSGPPIGFPKEAERIDGKGMVLAPGFTEALTQLGLAEVNGEFATVDAASVQPVTPAFRAADAFNPLSPRIAINRACGITSVIIAPGGTLLYGSGVWAELNGRLKEAPDPSKPVAMFGGVSGGAKYGQFGARGAMWLALRQIFADARFYEQNRAAFSKGQSPPLSQSPLQLEALLPVLRRELPFVLYLQRAADILAALRFAREERIRLMVAGGAEAYLLAAELAAADVPVLLKPSEQQPSSFDMLAARDDSATLLHQAGVKLVLSSYDWDNNVRRLRQEAGIAVAYGLPHAEALRAITSRPAELFGKTGVGMIKEGQRANVVLWSGDPLEVTSVARRVWIGGEPQALDHRQTELALRYWQPPKQSGKPKP